MARDKIDEARENRIHDEAVVDAYGEYERALSWYYYLNQKVGFPFVARCVAERRLSPLLVGEEVRVERMAPEDECVHELFVEITWSGRTMGVPLSQLEGIAVGEDAEEAIGDWHYWVARGYQF